MTQIKANYSLLLMLILLSVKGAKPQPQPAPTVTLSTGSVMAGDVMHLSVKLDHPVICDSAADVYFDKTPNPGDGISFRLPLKSGASAVDADVSVPRDVEGNYESKFLFIYPCEGYSKIDKITLPSNVLHINALLAAPQPTSAELALSFSVRQFLETRAQQIDLLSERLTTRLENNAVDSALMRSFLTALVKQADSELKVTEVAYRKNVLKNQSPSPAFFEDFHKQYLALLAELGPSSSTASSGPRGQTIGRIIFVQAQLRPRQQAPSIPLPNNSNGTYPPDAATVREVMLDNAAAYRYVKDVGRTTFNLRIVSYPAGAHIFYKKLVDSEYGSYTGLTNLSDVSLELATWDFRFQKVGCKNEPVFRLDPYRDSNRNVSVEFSRCSGH